MEKFIKKCRKNFGLIIVAFGSGLVIAVVAPFWSWILFVGASVVAAGTYFFKKK